MIALLATGLLEVPMIVVLTGLGPWFAKYRATGTTMMPTTTVRTNVTAPHSRRMNSPFKAGVGLTSSPGSCRRRWEPLGKSTSGVGRNESELYKTSLDDKSGISGARISVESKNAVKLSHKGPVPGT